MLIAKTALLWAHSKKTVVSEGKGVHKTKKQPVVSRFEK